MESLSTDWKYRGVLDDITELRTFVRIVAACPPPTERGLPLSVVSKRLATLERRAEVLLFATSTCSNQPSVRLKRRCRVTAGLRPSRRKLAANYRNIVRRARLCRKPWHAFRS
jgi:hypothetical protein